MSSREHPLQSFPDITLIYYRASTAETENGLQNILLKYIETIITKYKCYSKQNIAIEITQKWTADLDLRLMTMIWLFI